MNSKTLIFICILIVSNMYITHSKVNSRMKQNSNANDNASTNKIKRKLSKQEREDLTDDDDVEFKKFKEAFGKDYEDDSEEGQKRKKNFKANAKYIREMNNKNLDFKLGLGPWSDLSNEEYRETVLMKPEVIEKLDAEFDNDENSYVKSKKAQLKTTYTTFSWASYMGSIRNQKTCGSCWSFATVGAVEGNFSIKYGHKADLSEEELIDCNTDVYNPKIKFLKVEELNHLIILKTMES